MNPKKEKTALITGASLGIGYELAKLFAHDGYGLVLVSRNKAKLTTIAGEMKKMGSPWVKVVAKDLAVLEAPDELFSETEKSGIQVDVLVNNAGFGAQGSFSKTNLDDELDMMQLNMVALTHLTKLYLPQMLARKSGRIMNVGSTAGFQPGPLMAVYFATKAYVLSFSEALYEDLRGTGVTVTCLCPGATTTGFAERARLPNAKTFNATGMSAEEVARKGYAATMKGKPIVITGLRNWILAQSVRFTPRSVVRKFVRRLQEARG